MRLNEFPARLARKTRREIAVVEERLRNFCVSSYSILPVDSPQITISLFSFLDSAFTNKLAAKFPGFAKLLQQQSEAALAHVFDLLGSGPIAVSHGIPARGLAGASYPQSRPVRADSRGHWLASRINRTNLKQSQRIWQMIGPHYIPIDWQRDFISGYRWEERSWHRDIRPGVLLGVDIKVPWELARMQHLPNLAMACHFARQHTPGSQDAPVYEQELRNQILDFIATNPPGFGVNWACAMDVAIRCANLLVAHDIILASGERLDDAFERVFASSILAHARHVIKNLEWSPVYRGNHYLANIVGLLFASTYLPKSDEVDGWLAFSVQELMAEVDYQFHEDGSNFEASVCYHRLSSEMVLWGFALLSNLPAKKLAVLTQPDFHHRKNVPRLRPEIWALHPVPGSDRLSPVPPWGWERLKRMADFTEALTRPDGNVTQFGDNDSGRFLVLGSGEKIRANNDPAVPAWSLDHGSLLAGIRTLVVDGSHNADIDDAAAEIIRAFAGYGPTVRAATPVRSTPVSSSDIGSAQVWADHIQCFEKTPQSGRWKSRFSADASGLLDEIACQAFMGMGCFVFRSSRLYLAIRCGEIGICGLGAHAHCDQLGIELVLDGVDRVRDPGTFIYTASLEKRNAYRSATAHHVPRVAGREPANLNLGPFDLRGAAEGECLYFGSKGFIGRHAGYGAWVYRIVALEDDGISVMDYAEGALSLSDPTPVPLPFSSGYGYPASHVPSPL